MERLKRLTRRDFLRLVGGLGMGIAAWTTGCGRKTVKEETLLKQESIATEALPAPTVTTITETKPETPVGPVPRSTEETPTPPATTEVEPTQTAEIATEEREVNIWEKYFQIVDEEGGIPFKGKGMVNHVETVAPLQIAVLTGGPVEISNRNFPGGSNGEEQGTVVVMLPGEETVQYQMRVWAGANWHRVANVKTGAPSLSELATLVLEDRVKAMVDPEEKNCPAGKGCKIVDFAIVSPDRKIEVGQFPRK